MECAGVYFVGNLTNIDDLEDNLIEMGLACVYTHILPVVGYDVSRAILWTYLQRHRLRAGVRTLLDTDANGRGVGAIFCGLSPAFQIGKETPWPPRNAGVASTHDTILGKREISAVSGLGSAEMNDYAARVRKTVNHHGTKMATELASRISDMDLRSHIQHIHTSAISDAQQEFSGLMGIIEHRNKMLGDKHNGSDPIFCRLVLDQAAFNTEKNYATLKLDIPFADLTGAQLETLSHENYWVAFQKNIDTFEARYPIC